MGAQLVAKAFAFDAEHALRKVSPAPDGRPLTKLKPNEFRLLVHMALTALDTDTLPVYFGGRELSAYGLGWPVSTDSTELEARKAFQAVKVAVNGLIAAGAIRQLRHGRAGRNAEFALVFEHTGTPVPPRSRSVKITEHLPHESWDSIPLRGTESHAQNQGATTPKEPVRTTEELQGGQHRDSQAPYVLPVDNSRKELNHV